MANQFHKEVKQFFLAKLNKILRFRLFFYAKMTNVPILITTCFYFSTFLIIYILTFQFKYSNDMMKKAKQLKQTRKTNQTFFKYIQPSKPAAFSHQTKTHTRSMMELQTNVRYQQSARQPSHHNKQNHQMSLCNQAQEPQQEVKSNSLKKFLSLFGSNHNNPILHPSGNSLRLSTGRQEKSTSRGNRQVFTCNIKNMNVNVNNSKEKEHLENKTTLILKQKTESHSLISQLKHEKEDIRSQLEMVTLQYNEKEKHLKEKLKNIQTENAALKKEIAAMHDEKLIMQEKSALRERFLEKTIQNMQRNQGKERCRQHDLIIESLSNNSLIEEKVINEQLRKIIQLEKSKIEREEIEKLEERINLNMTGNEASVKEKLHYIQVKDMLKFSKREDLLRMAKKEEQIKIDDSFNQSALTSQQDHSRFEMIEQAEESQEFSREKSQEDGDSILQEVDKYLIQWRNKH